MAEVRLGIATRINDVELVANSDYLDYVVEKSKRSIGFEIAKLLADSDVPMVFRWHESLQDHFNAHGLGRGLEYRIICDHRPVEAMHVKELYLEPFEFKFRDGRQQSIEWQCDYCSQVNLVDEHLECRKCGAPRKVIRG